MGFTCAPAVTGRAVVSYTALPPLPGNTGRYHFCCTILGVTSTGRYPASCPVKPGLSSQFFRQILAADAQKIVQELEQPLCLKIFRIALLNTVKQQLRIGF